MTCCEAGIKEIECSESNLCYLYRVGRNLARISLFSSQENGKYSDIKNNNNKAQVYSFLSKKNMFYKLKRDSFSLLLCLCFGHL